MSSALDRPISLALRRWNSSERHHSRFKKKALNISLEETCGRVYDGKMIGLTAGETIALLVYVFLSSTCGGAWGIGMGWAILPVLYFLFPSDVASSTVLSGACVAYIVVKSSAATIEDLSVEKQARHQELRKPYFQLVLSAIIGVGLAYLARRILEGQGIDVALASSYALTAALLLILLIAAVFMLLRSTSWTPSLLQAPFSFAIGVGTGLLAGFLGIGGGVLRYPIYSIVMEMDSRKSRYIVQASVLAASVASLAMYWSEGHVYWYLVGFLCLAGVPGHMIGRAVANRLKESERPVIAFIVVLLLFFIMSLLQNLGKDFSGLLVISLGIGATGVLFLEWWIRHVQS